MKIADVEAMVLDTGKNYTDPQEASEAHGVRFVSLIKITTDEGLVGWSDIETQPHVGRRWWRRPPEARSAWNRCVQHCSGKTPSSMNGCGRRCTATRLLRTSGRRHADDVRRRHSAVDIAAKLWVNRFRCCWSRYREQVRAYASTTFRPTPTP